MCDSLPLRPNVCLLIRNSAGRLFLGERRGSPGIWQFPQGGVEPGQTPADSALREAHEELGVELHLLRAIGCLDWTHQYEFDEPPAYARGRWRGQTQTFWVLLFLGADADIKLNRFEPEFSSWRWCTPDEVLQQAEPKRRPGYRGALEEYQRRSW